MLSCLRPPISSFLLTLSRLSPASTQVRVVRCLYGLYVCTCNVHVCTLAILHSRHTLSHHTTRTHARTTHSLTQGPSGLLALCRPPSDQLKLHNRPERGSKSPPSADPCPFCPPTIKVAYRSRFRGIPIYLDFVHK